MSPSQLAVWVIRVLILCVVLLTALLTFMVASELETVTLVRVATMQTSCGTLESVQALAARRQQLKDLAAMKRRLHPIRNDNGFVLFDTPRGRYWATGDGELTNLAWSTLYIHDRDLYRSSHINAGHIVIDIGANLGTFTRLALMRVASKVIAVEPSPATVQCLRRTFAPEIAAGKVVVVPKGLWDKPATLPLSQNTDTSWNRIVQTPNQRRVVEVPLVTLDSLAADLNLPHVDFVKLDVNLAEHNVLLGARGFLQKYRAIWALDAEDYRDPGELTRLAEPYSYRAEAGACKVLYNHEVGPETLYFYRRN